MTKPTSPRRAKPARRSSTRANPHADRLTRLRTAMSERSAEAFLVTDPRDVAYLTGFLGGDSFLFVPASGKPTLISDHRYKEDLEPFKKLCRVVMRKGSIWGCVAERCAEAGFGDKRRKPTLLVQGDHLTLQGVDTLKKSLRTAKVPTRLITPTHGLLLGMRAVKDALEIRNLRRAIAIQEEALEATLPYAKPGVSEIELAARLEFEMKSRGSTEPGFLPIVGARANSSKPHYTPSPTAKLARGKPLLIDWGATYNGYRGDMTRTFVLGRKWPPKFAAMYDAVLEAHEAAAQTLRQGVRALDVDAAARKVIRKAGFGKNFNHGLGHGIGLNVHELPNLGPHSGETTLTAGNVVTIEPGVYLPGYGGVRLENDYLVTARGATNLCTLPMTRRWSSL